MRLINITIMDRGDDFRLASEVDVVNITTIDVEGAPTGVTVANRWALTLCAVRGLLKTLVDKKVREELTNLDAVPPFPSEVSSA